MQCTICKCFISTDQCHVCGATKKTAVTGKKPIKPIADKRKDELEEYKIEAKQYIKDNPFCAVYPEYKSEEVHHKAGRNGKRLMDKSKWLAVSKKAHRKITDDSAWAVEMGYSLYRNKSKM